MACHGYKVVSRKGETFVSAIEKIAEVTYSTNGTTYKPFYGGSLAVFSKFKQAVAWAKHWATLERPLYVFRCEYKEDFNGRFFRVANGEISFSVNLYPDKYGGLTPMFPPGTKFSESVRLLGKCRFEAPARRK